MEHEDQTTKEFFADGPFELGNFDFPPIDEELERGVLYNTDSAQQQHKAQQIGGGGVAVPSYLMTGNGATLMEGDIATLTQYQAAATGLDTTRLYMPGSVKDSALPGDGSDQATRAESLGKIPADSVSPAYKGGGTVPKPPRNKSRAAAASNNSDGGDGGGRKKNRGARATSAVKQEPGVPPLSARAPPQQYWSAQQVFAPVAGTTNAGVMPSGGGGGISTIDQEMMIAAQSQSRAFMRAAQQLADQSRAAIESAIAEQITALSERVTSLQGALDTRNATIQQLTTQNTQLAAQLSEVRKLHETANSEMQAIREKSSSYDERLTAMRTGINEAQDRALRELEQRITSNLNNNNDARVTPQQLAEVEQRLEAGLLKTDRSKYRTRAESSTLFSTADFSHPARFEMPMRDIDQEFRWLQTTDISANISLIQQTTDLASIGIVIMDDLEMLSYTTLMNEMRAIRADRESKAIDKKTAKKLTDECKAKCKQRWAKLKDKTLGNKPLRFIVAPYCVFGGTSAQYTHGHWILFVFEKSRNILFVFDSMMSLQPLLVDRAKYPDVPEMKALNANSDAVAADCVETVYSYELDILKTLKFMEEAHPEHSKIFKPSPDREVNVKLGEVEYAYHQLKPRAPNATGANSGRTVHIDMSRDSEPPSDGDNVAPEEEAAAAPPAEPANPTFFSQQNDVITCGHRVLLLIDWIVTMYMRGTADVSHGMLPVPYFKGQTSKFMYDSWCKATGTLLSKQLPAAQ